MSTCSLIIRQVVGSSPTRPTFSRRARAGQRARARRCLHVGHAHRILNAVLPCGYRLITPRPMLVANRNDVREHPDQPAARTVPGDSTGSRIGTASRAHTDPAANGPSPDVGQWGERSNPRPDGL